MRQLKIVIYTVFDHIPKDFEHRQELKDNFTYIIEKCHYTAPEVFHSLWKRLCDILTAFLPTDSEIKWAEQISQFVNDEIELPCPAATECENCKRLYRELDERCHICTFSKK